MKGFRFYIEYDSAGHKATNKPNGNIVAAWTNPNDARPGHLLCLSAIFSNPNSPCNWGDVALEYITENCKRTSEKHARSVHPKLFEVLDNAV